MHAGQLSGPFLTVAQYITTASSEVKNCVLLPLSSNQTRQPVIDEHHRFLGTCYLPYVDEVEWSCIVGIACTRDFSVEVFHLDTGDVTEVTLPHYMALAVRDVLDSSDEDALLLTWRVAGGSLMPIRLGFFDSMICGSLIQNGGFLRCIDVI
jgi:hypothetical protein